MKDPKASRGRCISAAAKAHPDDEAAKANAKAECPKGKPDHTGQGNGKAEGRPDGAGPPEGHPNSDDPCKGPPPWAGNAMTPAEKDAAKVERATTCGRDLDVDEDEAGDLEVEATDPPDQPGG